MSYSIKIKVDMRRLLLLILLSGVMTALARDYNIKDFGAVDNLKSKSTMAVQSAIDECHRQGGGRV